MKKRIPIFFLFLLLAAASTFAQNISDEELAREYRVKAMKFDNMRGRGLTMMIGGSLAFAGGIYALATAEYETDYYGNTTTSDPKYLWGLAGVYLGIPIIAGGTVLHVIGKRKFEQYSEKARKVTMEAGLTSNGVGLTLRF